MVKRIVIEISTEEDNDKIERYIQDWVKENFQKEAKIKIEEIQ